MLSRAAAVRTPPGTKRVLSVLFVAASLLRAALQIKLVLLRLRDDHQTPDLVS